MSDTHTLSVEAAAARTLLLNLKDVIADDDQAALDMIEGETSLLEAIDGALFRLDEIEALSEAITEQARALSARKERLGAQAERIRTSIGLAMGMASLRKLERPSATLSLKATPPQAVIVNEADVPSQFWKPQPPKLDKRLVLAALKDGDAVPGAELSNGGETIAIRRG